jgi:hypothetical protein
VKPEVALSRYESFHPVAQCWERDAHTLQLYAGRLTGHAFWEEENIRGYILLHDTTVMDLAVDPHADPVRVGTALLQRASADVQEAFCINKVAAHDPMRATLEQAGLASRESHVLMGLQIVKRGG